MMVPDFVLNASPSIGGSSCECDDYEAPQLATAPAPMLISRARAPASTRYTGSSLKSMRHREYANIGGAYVMFLLAGVIVLRQFSDGDFSAVLTFGAAIQCLGFYLLLRKVRAQRSVAGVSSKCLEMYVMSFLFRLASTLFKNGYLPVDRSGDWCYQAADIASLYILFQILYSIHKTHNSTYQIDRDTMDLKYVVPPCILLGICLHGNLNNSPFFDMMWCISMNLDTIALLPQLWMLNKIGGEVEGMTSHFVASIIISRACAFSFWFYGYKELAPHDGSANVAGWLIIVCHCTQLLLSGDFLYHYGSARLSGRRMVLPSN